MHVVILTAAVVLTWAALVACAMAWSLDSDER